MNEASFPLTTINLVVAVVILLFVTLAIGQIAVFNLNKRTKKNLRLHKAIAYLGMGSAIHKFRKK